MVHYIEKIPIVHSARAGKGHSSHPVWLDPLNCPKSATGELYTFIKIFSLDTLRTSCTGIYSNCLKLFTDNLIDMHISNGC